MDPTKGVVMELVVALFLILDPLALVGLFGWVNRKLGWPDRKHDHTWFWSMR